VEVQPSCQRVSLVRAKLERSGTHTIPRNFPGKEPHAPQSNRTSRRIARYRCGVTATGRVSPDTRITPGLYGAHDPVVTDDVVESLNLEMAHVAPADGAT